MKILVFGANGQVGNSIKDIEKSHLNKYKLKFFNKKTLDVSNKKHLTDIVIMENPAIIINASAYTAVDKAETESKKANIVNNISVTNLAKVCKKNNVSLIHYSTDYVFDGRKKTAYKEIDKTNPKSVYGKSKLNGEKGIVSSGCNYIILRTSWVYSEYGKNFLKTIMRLSENKKIINVVNDQYGCPTSAKDIAIATSKVIPLIDKRKYQGVYNFCGNKNCSWYDFAKRITFHNKILTKKDVKIRKIKSFEYKAPAYRPQNSSLCCNKFNNTFGKISSDLDKSIIEVINKLRIDNKYYD